MTTTPDRMPFSVVAEFEPGVPDSTTPAAFADFDRAREYARGLATNPAYASGGVWLTDPDAPLRRIDTADRR